MASPPDRYEIVKGSSSDEEFVELWDRSLAPAGLAFEILSDTTGELLVMGHGVRVPVDALEAFLAEAKTYLS